MVKEKCKDCRITKVAENYASFQYRQGYKFGYNDATKIAKDNLIRSLKESIQKDVIKSDYSKKLLNIVESVFKQI